MSLKIYQVDAFTSKVFGGNPAAVVPLDAWLPDVAMQAIAAENNLAETAFFVPEAGRYGLRWFTPTQEVPLCGHATLASAFVIFTEIDPVLGSVEFSTQSGTLTVTRAGDLLRMDFPRHALTEVEAPFSLLVGLRAVPSRVYFVSESPNYYAVYATEAEIRALTPEFAEITQLDALGVIATAPGEDCDFVSRYFAPKLGIPEDPATGSTHCALAPYWGERLGKTELFAQQVSVRGGDLFCTVTDQRVLISGQAALYSRGEIFVSGDVGIEEAWD